MHMEHRMELFACRASKDFACKVVDGLNIIGAAAGEKYHLGASEVTRFSDGEFVPSFTDSVRGATVFILQSTFPPTENLMELLLTIDAAKRASADKVIAVMPYFGWARQDRKDKPRVSIGAKLVANLLTAAGVDRIMTCDLHADQIQGFFDLPVDHIYASKVFIPYLRSLNIENLAIAAPDMGGAKRANAYAKELACPVIICHKSRERANVVASITAIGTVFMFLEYKFSADGKRCRQCQGMRDTCRALRSCLRQNQQLLPEGSVRHRHHPAQGGSRHKQDKGSLDGGDLRGDHPQGLQLRAYQHGIYILRT